MAKAARNSRHNPIGNIKHRMGLATHFKATGQMPAVTYVGQSGHHAFPAKVVDPATREMIDAALAAKLKEN